jgi:hypothetical protein
LGSNEKTRAKKIGSFALVTVTVTTGFTPNEGHAPVQSALDEPVLPAYFTDTVFAAAPLIRFCGAWATLVADKVAGLLEPPQTVCQENVLFVGSPVMPESEIVLAAVRAAASAAR